MPEVSSDLEASNFQLVPDGIQNAHVIKVEGPRKTQSQLGDQVTLDWQIDEGEYTGRDIRFDNLSLGGKYKDQKTGELKPLNTAAFCQFLNESGVPWNCRSCNNARQARKFHIGTADEPAIKGKYVCPDCKSPNLAIAYNSDNFMGARCGIKLSSQKKTTTVTDPTTGVVTKVVDPDKEFNVVKGYTPLKVY